MPAGGVRLTLMGASAFMCQPPLVAMVTLAVPLAPVATLGSVFLISYSLASARAAGPGNRTAAARTAEGNDSASFMAPQRSRQFDQRPVQFFDGWPTRL